MMLNTRSISIRVNALLLIEKLVIYKWSDYISICSIIFVYNNERFVIIYYIENKFGTSHDPSEVGYVFAVYAELYVIACDDC